MKIFAEILPRIGCANVTVTGDRFGGDDLDSLVIKCGKTKVRLDETEFDLPGIELADNSMSGLVLSEQGACFRLKLKQNEKFPAFLPAGRFNYGGRLKFPVPKIDTCQTYSLTCQCGFLLGSVTPDRVLPLPSGSWKADSLDWYCCVHKLKKPPVLQPRSNDLLYNSYSFVVDKSNFSDAAVVHTLGDSKMNNSEETEFSDLTTIITCSRCDVELGSLVRESAYIWSNTVLLKSGESILRSNVEVETAEDCFKMIINSHVIESISAMPKLVVTNRTDQSLVIWIIDKDLTVVKSGTDNVVKETVMKVLFKKESNVPDSSLENVEVSNSIFYAGLKMLENSTKNLPESFKFANEFHVAYFPKC